MGAVKCSTLSVPGCVAGAAIFFSLSLHPCVCVYLRNALSKPIEPLNRIGLLSLPQRPQEPLDGLQWPRRRRTHSQNYWKKQPSALNTDVLSKDASIFLPSDSKRCHSYLSLESNYMLDIFYTIPGHFLLFLVLHVFLDISSYFFWSFSSLHSCNTIRWSLVYFSNLTPFSLITFSVFINASPFWTPILL